MKNLNSQFTYGLYCAMAVILFIPLLTQAQTATPIPNVNTSANPSNETYKQQSGIQDQNNRLQHENEPSRNSWYRSSQAEQNTFFGLLIGLFATLINGLFLLITATHKIWTNNSKLDVNKATTIEMLNHYHVQALGEHQANRRAALGVSLIGVAIIFLGALLAFMGSIQIGTVTAISGVLSEAIGALFFYQSAKSRDRVKEIEDKLYVQSLLNNLNDPSRADDARIQIATRRLQMDSQNSKPYELTQTKGQSERNLLPASEQA